MKIFDTQFSHAISAGTPYDDTKIPFNWERNFSNINPNELVFFTESDYFTSKQIKHNKKILWILESPAFSVSESVINDIICNNEEFYKILTHDDRLLSLHNSILFPVGGCWIKPNDVNIYQKNKLVSSIASKKNTTFGQKLRHQISSHPKVNTFGPSYTPINYKLEALKDFKFSICTENFKNDSYFTEKIIDCFTTGTIPIYYGCNKISNFFNSNGIIEVDNFEELTYIIDHLENIEIDQQAIKDNFELSKEYMLPEKRILSIFL